MRTENKIGDRILVNAVITDIAQSGKVFVKMGDNFFITTINETDIQDNIDIRLEDLASKDKEKDTNGTL
jgi:hypothetical protein